VQLYHFVTRWSFEAPVERVWEEASNVEAYPEWWGDLRKARIRGPDSTLKVGSIVDCEVKGRLPYTLRFTIEVTIYEPPHAMEVRSSGDLVGTGRWLLEAAPGGTVSTFNWDVGTSNPILNLLGRLPFVRAMLEKNHDDVMARGYEIVRSRLES